MAQSAKFLQIAGVIYDREGISYQVELTAVVGVLIPRKGPKSECLSSISFADGSSVPPDGGPYRLCYLFQGKQYEEEIRVKRGTLILVS